MDAEDECENGWCPRQEKLLHKWCQKSAGYRWLHNHARLHFKRQNDMFSIPSIIISSITGVGGFAVLSPSEDDVGNDSARRKIVLAQYFFATLNVISGILTSISKFSRASELSEQHSNMCVAYSKFYRQLDMELSIERKNRPPMLEFVVKMRKEYDRLLDEAPDIPAVSIKAFNEKFWNDDSFAKPDVVNGLSIISSEMSADDADRGRSARRRWGSALRAATLFRRANSNSNDNISSKL